MKKKLFLVFFLFCAVGVVFVYEQGGRFQSLALVARFFTETISPETLKRSYDIRPITILIVPGHDNENSGTEFNGLREADVNLRLSEKLYQYFSSNKRFTTQTVRDFKTGNYTDEFQNYFTKEKDTIHSYVIEKKILMSQFVDQGLVDSKKTNNHNFASSEVGDKLYGINKWANEHNIDIVIHVHFNDEGGRKYNQVGKHTGFSIYIPERQFSNARASQDVAEQVKKELSTFIAPSNLPIESDTVIETQELIAVGANATRDKVSFLVEYSYIYEPHIQNPDILNAFIEEAAYKTYMGIVRYFEPTYIDQVLYGTTLLPYYIDTAIGKNMKIAKVDVYHMQVILRREGVYPPQGKNLSDCPITGVFGSCTEKAVKQFQEKYKSEILEPWGLSAGNGFVGGKTLQKINSLYR